MAIFKCKLCGEALDLSTAQGGACRCAVCGMYQTVSTKIDDSANVEMLYGNASHFRKNGEFDLAISVYQQIIALDDTDAEAYFNVALCRYGIEYVKDPRTSRTLPTVNRTQLKAFSDDDDFCLALRYASNEQRAEYIKQAELIDEILKGYWQISNNEAPFDVFICYKETALDGETRTEDSAIAQSLYRELTRDGLKVFYARETLKGKLGSEYEPYIFAALNSARFMIVVGTKKEYFNAVWVKNEWARYLLLISQGKKKTLIPVYRDINAYDLPKEFKNLQAQNYAEVGATDNIVLAIENVLKQERPTETVVKETTVIKQTVTEGSTQTEATLLKKAYQLLSEGNSTRVNDCIERILNMNFACAEAYFIKFLSDNGYKGIQDFEKRAQKYEKLPGYDKVVEYAEGEFAKKLQIIEKNITYNRGMELFKADKFEKAARILVELGDYRDAEKVLVKCAEKIYAKAEALFKKKKYKDALSIFLTVPGFADAEEKAEICKKEIERSSKKTTKRVITTFIILALLGAAILAAFVVLFVNSLNSDEYKFSINEVDGGISIGYFADYEDYIDESGCLIIPSEIGGKAVVEIRDGTINYKYGFTSIKIPDTVERIETGALANRDVESYITQNNSFYTTVDGNLYTKDKTVLVQYALGKREQSFEIPKSVEEIGAKAFYECQSLQSLIIPDTVYSIGELAFANASIRSIEIPETIETIGYNPFYNCNFAEARMHISFVSRLGYYDCPYVEDLTLYGEDGVVAAWGGSGLLTLTLEDGITEIGASAFSSSTLEGVIIPNSVTKIGKSAFVGCENLSYVEFEDTDWSANTDYDYVNDCERWESIEGLDNPNNAALKLRGRIGEYDWQRTDSINAGAGNDSYSDSFECTDGSYNHDFMSAQFESANGILISRRICNICAGVEKRMYEITTFDKFEEARVEGEIYGKYNIPNLTNGHFSNEISTCIASNNSQVSVTLEAKNSEGEYVDYILIGIFGSGSFPITVEYADGQVQSLIGAATPQESFEIFSLEIKAKIKTVTVELYPSYGRDYLSEIATCVTQTDNAEIDESFECNDGTYVHYFGKIQFGASNGSLIAGKRCIICNGVDTEEFELSTFDKFNEPELIDGYIWGETNLPNLINGSFAFNSGSSVCGQTEKSATIKMSAKNSSEYVDYVLISGYGGGTYQLIIEYADGTTDMQLGICTEEIQAFEVKGNVKSLSLMLYAGSGSSHYINEIATCVLSN